MLLLVGSALVAGAAVALATADRAADSGGAAARGSAAAPVAAAPVSSTEDRALLSYGVGFDLGRRAREGFVADGVDADRELVIRGFADALAAKPSAYDDDEIQRVLRAVHREMLARAATERMRHDAAFRQFVEEAAARSADALAAFGALPEVKPLNDGILGRRSQTGSGPSVGDARHVRATWLVKRSDGVDVDQGAAVVEVRSLLPAIARAIAVMNVGDRWTLGVPPAAGYGLGGDPPRIGPNETLFAEIGIEEIVSDAAASEAAPRKEGSR